MLILDPYDMTFDAVGVFGLDFWLLFKSALSYCEWLYLTLDFIHEKQFKLKIQF